MILNIGLKIFSDPRMLKLSASIFRGRMTQMNRRVMDHKFATPQERVHAQHVHLAKTAKSLLKSVGAEDEIESYPELENQRKMIEKLQKQLEVKQSEERKAAAEIDEYKNKIAEIEKFIDARKTERVGLEVLVSDLQNTLK